MSDTQRGPGWWIASDGRWYPPESHADPDWRARWAGAQPPGASQGALPAWPAPDSLAYADYRDNPDDADNADNPDNPLYRRIQPTAGQGPPDWVTSGATTTPKRPTRRIAFVMALVLIVVAAAGITVAVESHNSSTSTPLSQLPVATILAKTSRSCPDRPAGHSGSDRAALPRPSRRTCHRAS